MTKDNNQRLKVVLTGGGTAGHVYPNIAIYESIRREYKDATFAYVGTQRGAESKIVANLPQISRFVSVPSRGLPRNIRSIGTLLSLAHIFLGLLKSYFFLRRFKPDIIIGTGGFVAAPVLLAAALLKQKVLIHEQNSVPGRLNRFVARFSRRVCVTFASTAQFFPEHLVKVTGYPVRTSIRKEPSADLRSKFQIPEENRVLFVFGGSLGARTINNAVAALLPDLLKIDNLTVILATGRGYSKEYKAFEETVKKLEGAGIPTEIPGKLIVREYFNNIDDIYAITDLVISRAGAGTIEELANLNIPSILIPKIDLPGDHQILNAQEVAKTGAARLVYEEIHFEDRRRTISLPEESLRQLILDLIFSDDRLKEMRQKLRSIKKEKSTELILQEITDLIEHDSLAKERNLKVLYLQLPDNEKSYELLFNSTTLGNSLLCDVSLENIERDIRFDIRLFDQDDRIILKRRRGTVRVNDGEVSDWVELKEEDRIQVEETELLLKSYSERVTDVDYERKTSSKVMGSSLGIMFSRLGGFFREMVTAAYFGVGRAMDIFAVGLTISNLMRRVVAENALENAFLPIFSRLFHRSPRKRTWLSTSSIMNFTLLLALSVVAIGIALTPLILKTFFPAFVQRAMIDEAITMTRLLFPYLFLVTIAASMSTILKAFNRFGVAEFSAIFFSIGSITGILLLYPIAGIYSLAYGVLLGGIMQITCLTPLVHRVLRHPFLQFKYHFKLELDGSANRKYYSQLGPITVDVLLAKISEIVDQVLASSLIVGSISALYYAKTLFRLPYAIISQAINSVILKEFSDKIALFDKDKARRLFIDGIKTNLFLLTPIAVLMFILAQPIVSLLLQRFRFDAIAAANTAFALKFYALGLLGWGIHSLTVRIFSARLNIKASMQLNFLMLLTNIGLCLILVKTDLKYAGLALATSISFTLFAFIRILVLRAKLKKEHINVSLKSIAESSGKILISALLMIIVTVATENLFESIIFTSRVLGNIFQIISISFVGVSVYFLSSLMLKNTEILIFKSRKRRQGRDIPISMCSPFRFLEMAGSDTDRLSEDFKYKINIYLASAEWQVRNVGIKLIGLFKDRSKFDYLVELLNVGGENGFMRRNALISIRQLGLWRDISSNLVKTSLKDSYFEVRVAALRYLSDHARTVAFDPFREVVFETLRGATIEEKVAITRLLAEVGNEADFSKIQHFSLSSSSLLREALLECILQFFKRGIFSAGVVKEISREILITSNNMVPKFKIKVLLNKIYREIGE